MACSQVTEGLLDAAQKILGDDVKTEQAMRELKNYRSKVGVFGRPTVQNLAKSMTAWEWWRDWGGSAPMLRQLAMKVLSQAASACSCERNWSNFGFIHSRLRNRLTAERAADLVYVFSNLRVLKKFINQEEIEYHMWDVEEL